MTSEWMVIQDGKRMGPYSFEQLISQAKTGVLNPSSLLQKEEAETWSRAEQIPGLFSDVAQTTTSPAAMGMPVTDQEEVGSVNTGKIKKSLLFPVLAITTGLLLLIGGSVLAFSLVAQNSNGEAEEAGEATDGAGLEEGGHGDEFVLSPFDESEQNQDELEDESGSNSANTGNEGSSNSGNNNNPGGNNSGSSDVPYWHTEIYFETIPAGARIYIDDIYIGNTPHTEHLGWGVYKVTFRKDGYKEKSGRINVVGNRRQMLSISLLEESQEPNWRAEIHFETIPTGARLYIDDVYIGNTPHTEHLGWGVYKVTFRKDGFREKVGSINVANSRRQLLSTSLVEEGQEPPVQNPVAAISINPENPRVNETVSFSGFESRSPGGQVTGYSWEFNQGESGSGMNIVRAFDQPGTYQVRLTITDNLGLTASETIEFSVEAADDDPTSQNPVAVIRMNPAQQGRINEAVRFSGFYSRSPGGLITSYTWDFCQGESGSGVNIERVFDQPGTYQVRLTVTDNRGLTASETLEFRIIEGRFSINPPRPRDSNNAGDVTEPIVAIIPDPEPILAESQDTRVSIMIKKLTVLESYQREHVLAGFREPRDVAISCFVLSGLHDPAIEIPGDILLHDNGFILKTGDSWSMNLVLHEAIYVRPVELEINMIAHHHTSSPSYGPYVAKGSIRIPVNRDQLAEEESNVTRVRTVEKQFILDQPVADNSPIRAKILVEMVVIYTLPLPGESQ